MIDVSDDLYALLEVSPLATQEEIKKAYHAVAKKYHPDIYHGSDAQQRFQKINAAYEVLKDPLQRAKYDSFLNTIRTTKSNSDKRTKTDSTDQGYIPDPVDVDHNFYTDLDLELFADENKIKKAFEILSEKYDPNTSLVPNAREKLRKITFAYLILSDPIKKERYDYLLLILVKFSPKKETQQKQTYSQTTNGKTSSSSQADSEQKSSEKNSRNTSSNSYANSSKTNDTYRQESQNSNINYQYSSDNSSNSGCLKAFLIIALALLVFYMFSKCSTDDRSSYSQYANTTRRTSTPKPKTYTPTPKSTIFSKDAQFIEHYIEIDVEKNYDLDYYLPNDEHTYTYSVGNDSIINVTSNHDYFSLKIKGIHSGNTTIRLYDEKNNVIDECNVRVRPKNIKPSSVPTATKVTPKRTSTPVSGWSFEKEKINIKAGETIELHFSKPPYAAFTYFQEKYGIISVTHKNSYTLIITGVKSGTTDIYLRNENDKVVATCTVTVSGNTRKNITPTPLLGKKGGYTEKELIENGHIGAKKPDGTMYYPGFYQAPNGNYYPTGN